MGLFTPNPTPQLMEYIARLLSQSQDCAQLINSTTKPDVFFKRLNFLLDLLLELQQYEKYKVFKSGTPSADYKKILNNLEATVNDFIDRAQLAHEEKIRSLKTDKAKKRNREDFAIKLISAFDCAHTFWSGSISQSRFYPHYTGPLYTQNNYRRVQEIYDNLDYYGLTDQ